MYLKISSIKKVTPSSHSVLRGLEWEALFILKSNPPTKVSASVSCVLCHQL